jgi:hypothetical protein
MEGSMWIMVPFAVSVKDELSLPDLELHFHLLIQLHSFIISELFQISPSPQGG